MEITLEQIELVKDKTGASYKEAKEALEKANGSVVDAIVAIEENINAPMQAANILGEVAKAIESAVKRSNACRLIIKNGEELFADIPLSIGLIDLFFSPWAAVTALVSFLGENVNITLVDDKGKTTDITAIVHSALGEASARTGVVYENIKNKGAEYADIIKTKGAEYADILKTKGAAAVQSVKDKSVVGASAVMEKGSEVMAEAVEKANAAFDSAKDKLTDLINERSAASKETLMDDEDLFSEIEEEFKDEE